MKFALIMEAEIRWHRFRPPCPRCKRRMWPTCGLDEVLVFYCFVHGYWMRDPVEDDQGQQTPFFRWRTYDWRLE